MLGLALGGKTEKMRQGHHGANHPVKDFTTGKVEIVSMNHGFALRILIGAEDSRGRHAALAPRKTRPALRPKAHPS